METMQIITLDHDPIEAMARSLAERLFRDAPLAGYERMSERNRPLADVIRVTSNRLEKLLAHASDLSSVLSAQDAAAMASLLDTLIDSKRVWQDLHDPHSV